MKKAFNSIITNTKVRRLGYFLQIVKEVGETSLAEETLLARLTSWAENNANFLNQYIDSTGVIRQSTKSTSARRYLSSALQIELVAKIGREYKLTKHGKVLSLFTSEGNLSPFLLTLKQKCFLLNKLLLFDLDYLIPLLQLLRKLGKCTLSSLQDEFREAVLSWSGIKSNSIFSEESRKRNELLRVENRIKSWCKPKKYIEHIVPPRIHWFLDLQLIDWDFYKKTRKFALSKKGNIFLSHLPQTQNHLYVDCDWLENDYFEDFILAFSPESAITRFSQLPHKKQHEIMHNFLKRSFDVFGATDVLRIAASQFLYYTCVELAITNKIACGVNDLKQSLNKISSSGKSYYFYWSAQQNDGHITKR